ncbi:hypothetical protein [Amaricoccus sp.]|uniref:hypothetical protein n=1 Tax=Amaricoccus sp. TaxID=1872485 RepID=UPI001B402A70|nr:hypothetical protein [Amaricoccus sp.]MBP7003337.1 hypothetical protein [Amaricoccus sp.]
MIGALAIVAWTLAIGPAEAQVVCRRNALGTEVCTGMAVPTNRGRLDPPRQGRGIAGVQARPTLGPQPELTPARRISPLGTTLLGAEDLPPRRPPLPGVAPTRRCVTDALGNLICN